MTVKPNFFILGAPKCGTTSLAAWLANHPEVFIPGVRETALKEPHFFNTDHRNPRRPSRAGYEALFRNADGAAAVGEASVWYLASHAAVPAILEYNPEARFIACLRNPVPMAYSLHNQQLFTGVEPIRSFRRAWEAQDARARSLLLPRHAEPQHLQYGAMCSLGSQLARLFEQAPRERVHLVFLDDLARDPVGTFRGVTEFLGVTPQPPVGETENHAVARRSLLLSRIGQRVEGLKRALGIERSLGLFEWVERWNRKPQKWAEDPEMTAELRAYFAPEVELLEKLTERDLSHWKKPA